MYGVFSVIHLCEEDLQRIYIWPNLYSTWVLSVIEEMSCYDRRLSCMSSTGCFSCTLIDSPSMHGLQEMRQWIRTIVLINDVRSVWCSRDFYGTAIHGTERRSPANTLKKEIQKYGVCGVRTCVHACVCIGVCRCMYLRMRVYICATYKPHLVSVSMLRD